MKCAFQHVVLFSASALSADDDARYADLIADFSVIPGVCSVSGGRIATSGADFTHALLVEFTDEEAYRAHRPHPVHRRFADWMVPQSEVTRLDFHAPRHLHDPPSAGDDRS